MEVPSPFRPLASGSHSHLTRLTSSPSPPSTVRAESSSATGLRNAQFSSRPALPTLLPLSPIRHEQSAVTESNGSGVETVAKRRNTHGEASLSSSPQQKASSSAVAGLGQQKHTSLYTLKSSERATNQGKPYAFGSICMLGLRVPNTELLEKQATQTDTAHAFKRESVTETKPTLPGLMPSKLYEPTPPLAVGGGLPQLRRPASPSPLAPAQLNDVVTPHSRGGVVGGIRGLASASYGALSSSPAAASSPYAPSTSNDNTSSPSSPYTMHVGGASIRKSLSVMRAGSMSVASSPNNNSGVSSKALTASPLRSGSGVRVSPFDLIRRNGSALRDNSSNSATNTCTHTDGAEGVNGSSNKRLSGGEAKKAQSSLKGITSSQVEGSNSSSSAEREREELLAITPLQPERSAPQQSSRSAVTEQPFHPPSPINDLNANADSSHRLQSETPSPTFSASVLLSPSSSSFVIVERDLLKNVNPSIPSARETKTMATGGNTEETAFSDSHALDSSTAKSGLQQGQEEKTITNANTTTESFTDAWGAGVQPPPADGKEVLVPTTRSSIRKQSCSVTTADVDVGYESGTQGPSSRRLTAHRLSISIEGCTSTPFTNPDATDGGGQGEDNSRSRSPNANRRQSNGDAFRTFSSHSSGLTDFRLTFPPSPHIEEKPPQRGGDSRRRSTLNNAFSPFLGGNFIAATATPSSCGPTTPEVHNISNNSKNDANAIGGKMRESVAASMWGHVRSRGDSSSAPGSIVDPRDMTLPPSSLPPSFSTVAPHIVDNAAESGNRPQLIKAADVDDCVRANTTLAFDDDKASGTLRSDCLNDFTIPVVVVGAEGVSANTSLSSLGGAMAASATPRAALLNANTFSPQGEAGLVGGGTGTGGGGQRRVSIYEEPKPNGRKHSRSVSMSASLGLDVPAQGFPVERRRSSAHKAEGDASGRPWMAHIRRGGGASSARLVEEHAEHCNKSSVVELRAWLCAQPAEKLADEIIKLRMLLFGRASESALATAQNFTDLGSSHFLGGAASLECSNNPSASGQVGFGGVDNFSFSQQYHTATVSYNNGAMSPTSMAGPEPMPNAMLNLPTISNFGTVPCPIHGGRSRANSLAVASMHEIRTANNNGANYSDVPTNATGGLVSARMDLSSLAAVHNTKQQPHLLSPVRVPQPSLATQADHRLSCMSADSVTQRIVNNYTFVGVIGRGQYGTVWQAMRDGGFFAIKSIPKAKLKPRFAMPRPSMDSCTPTFHVSGFPQVRPSQDHGALMVGGDRAPDKILPLFSASTSTSIKMASHRSQAEVVNVTDASRPEIAFMSGNNGSGQRESVSPPAPMMATTAPQYPDTNSEQNKIDQQGAKDEEQHALWGGGGVSLSKSNAISLFCGADVNAYSALNNRGNASRTAHRQLPPASSAVQRSSPPRAQVSAPKSGISKVPSSTTARLDVGLVDEAETSVHSEFSAGSAEEPANCQSPSVTPVFALKNDTERDRVHRRYHVQISAPPANDDEHDFLPAMSGQTSQSGAILNFQSIRTSLIRGRGFEGAEDRDVNGGSHSPPPPPLGKDIAYSINFANSLSSRANLPATSQSTAATGTSIRGGGGEVMLGSGTLMSPPTTSSISVPNGGGGSVVFETTSEMKKEIEVMKALRHRNIVSLTEVLDEPDDPYIYLVMPYIEKGPIVTLVDNRCSPLHIDKIANYLLQVLSAVRYLHNKEIVHCDIKPDNILIGGDGQAYLVDFGVSQMFKSTPYNDNNTDLDHTDNDDSSFAQSHANTHSILSSYSQQFTGNGGGGAPPRDRGGATVITPNRSGRQSPRMQLSQSNTQSNLSMGNNEALTSSIFASGGAEGGYYGSGNGHKSRATASSSGTEVARGGGGGGGHHPTTIVGLGSQSPCSTTSLTVVDMVSSGPLFGRGVGGGGQAHSTVVPSSSSRPPKEASRAQSTNNAPTAQPLSSSSGEFSNGAYTPSMASLPPPGARRIDSRFSNVTTRPNGSCPSSAGLTRMTGVPLTQGKDSVYFYGHRQHRPSIQYKHGYALSSTKCSPAFAAPETLVPYGEFNGAKADMWSLGITLYVLLFGRTPYTGVTASAVFKQIEDPDFIEFNAPLSDKNYEAAKRVVALIKKYNCDEAPTDHPHSKARDPVTTIEDSSEQTSESFIDHSVLVAIAASSSAETPNSSPSRRDLPLDGSSSPLPAVGMGKGRGAISSHLSAAQSASEMLVSLSANVTLAEDPKEIERLEEALQDMSSTCALQAAVHALELRTTYNANVSWSAEEMDEIYEYACVLNPTELTLLGFSPESPIVKKYTLCLTFLTKLLDRDPAKRISANTAISDVFFKELDPAARTLREIRQRQMARSKPTK